MTPQEAVAPYARYFERSEGQVVADLVRYCALLEQWQRVQNLVSRETLPDVWDRHIADSLQLLKHLTPSDRQFIDLGSGGGLPSLPLAIALNGRADVRLTLIEPNARKVSFLRTVARELALPVEVIGKRSDEIDSRETFSPDVITSRAVAGLPALCGMAGPFFGPQMRALFHKGREYRAELLESDSLWAFDVLVLPSDTAADSVLLEMRNLRAKSAR